MSNELKVDKTSVQVTVGEKQVGKQEHVANPRLYEKHISSPRPETIRDWIALYRDESDDEYEPFINEAGPLSELSLLASAYNMDTVIHDRIESNVYTIRDRVEGKVDRNGHPIELGYKLEVDE